MGTAQVWHQGEDVAARHLAALGWRILDRNWRCPAGELDIVAVESGPEPVLVFCEVKCRRGLGYGTPLESITARKIAKLREVGLHWLRAAESSYRHVRIDGIGVLLSPSGPPVIRHVRGIGS